MKKTTKKTAKKTATPAKDWRKIRTTNNATKAKPAPVEEPAARTKQAIDAKRFDAFFVEPERCLVAGLDTNDGPEHPCYQQHGARTTVDDTFVASVSRRQLNPIELWKDPEGRLYVVQGRRRVLALRAANERRRASGDFLLRARATFVKDDAANLFRDKIEENRQRVNTSPLDNARDANQFIDLGRTLDEAAAMFRVSGQTISNWLKLLDLAPEVQAAIDEGKISPFTALKRCYGKPLEVQRAVVEGKADALPKVGAPKGPSKKRLLKLRENNRLAAMHPMFVLAVRWFLGEIDDSEVLGDTVPPPAAKDDDE